MKIMTARLGEVKIDTANIITFPDGIIGFPDFKRYVELHFLEDSPIRLLQAVDTPDLGFFIVDPRLFVPEYIIDISQEEVKNLNADTVEDLEVKTIVTIPENPFEMTANLQGPLVISRKTKLARQIVNSNQKYNTRHKVLHGSHTVGVSK
ncbi:Flagellar assembly factor FliW [hydrothermal vent metagenome]|uniref:Flagellar assembly factor FliW n=1 Tax=hydrothermal vent metagenome TaxID=652676 RepID=A0A3B1CIB5_9ZZZZ